MGCGVRCDEFACGVLKSAPSPVHFRCIDSADCHSGRYRFTGSEPESTDGFVGSAFGAGWPLGWCVCAGRRVLGRAGLECGAGAVGGGWGSAALRGALSGGSDEQG